MSPLNRGPLLGPRVPPAGIRPPPPPRFGGRLPPPGLPPRMPPPHMNPVFGTMRQRLPPPPRPGGVSRPSGPMPLFGPRVRVMAPMVPPMGLRAAGPRGPPMRPWSRRGLPPQILPHMRPRFSIGNGNAKGKSLNNMKKVSKLEELELKKPWMTDEIRSEIQKKNKLYAKAKKNKDAKEWEEFKDLRNKVTRMIREAKNDYLAKHPEQLVNKNIQFEERRDDYSSLAARSYSYRSSTTIKTTRKGGQKTDDKNTIESEGVQKTENATEQSEQTELMEENQPSSEQAHLYPSDEEPYDQRDENCSSSEECESYYCELCDKDFSSEDDLIEHKKQHSVCGIAGCTFSAHPLLLQKHITMQHNSGLYDKIKNVTSPEDIEKWLTERKKRYPTKANIELRKAEELEKVKRGEIIKQKVTSMRQKKQKPLRFQNRKRKMPRTPAQTCCDNVEDQKLYRGLREFSGTLSLRRTELQEEDEFDDRIVDDECEESANFISDEEEASVSLIKPVITIPSLPALVADYGTASDDSEAPEEVPIKKVRVEDDIAKEDSIKKDEVQNISEIVENITENKDVEQCSNVASQESSSTKDTTISENKHKESSKLNKNSKDTERRRNIKKKQPYTSQLLERLLSRSVQHERNLICQCIKYIVDNNFFD